MHACTYTFLYMYRSKLVTSVAISFAIIDVVYWQVQSGTVWYMLVLHDLYNNIRALLFGISTPSYYCVNNTIILQQQQLCVCISTHTCTFIAVIVQRITM